MIRIRDLRKTFHQRPVLNGIDLDIDKGDMIFIIGRSGCGKSTLLRCLAGLEQADSGEIDIDARLAGGGRTRTGMVFQNFNLFPHLTALENVMKAPMVVKKMPRAQAAELAESLLAKVGLSHHIDHLPRELSGGQQQRAAIARALAMSPSILLYDEPTSALDPELVDEVLAVMKSLDREGMTQIVVSHEMRFARDAADRVVYMENGRVVEVNPPEIMFSKPQDERTGRFLRKYI